MKTTRQQPFGSARHDLGRHAVSSDVGRELARAETARASSPPTGSTGRGRTTRGSGQTAFTLIEMIGVIAIMGILAATIAPNALHMLERAAVRAEVDTLHNLGEQVKLYLRDTGATPTAANWNVRIADYASLSSQDLLFNRRQRPPVLPADALARTDVVFANNRNYVTRIFVIDPDPAYQRAIFLSTMRTDVRLPNYLLPTPNPIPAVLPADFSAIWEAPDGTVPVAPGWNAWNADNIEFLVIERINLRMPEQQFVLWNEGDAPVNYRTENLNGTQIFQQDAVPARDLATGAAGYLTIHCQSNRRLNLYAGPVGPVPNYSYVVGPGDMAFVFNGTNWIPKP